MTVDLIGRAEAQTAIQFAARRYTVAHEAHGEGRVVWSDNLINVTDAMNVLRDLPSVQSETNCSEIPNSSDAISRQAEQSACEYCREDLEGYVKPIEKNGHAFVRFGVDGWELSLSAKGWHGGTKIRFCPMCGRKLRGEQK